MGRRRFFRGFSEHFCMTPEHLFFKRQYVEEKSAENLRKNLRTKYLHKNGRRNLRTQKGRKKGHKICAKNRFEHSIFLEDGRQKKSHKKSLHQSCAKPKPQPRRIGSSRSWYFQQVLAGCQLLRSAVRQHCGRAAPPPGVPLPSRRVLLNLQL